MKELFVEEAQRELQRRNAEVSFSKITAMTGTHRKDVAQLLQNGPQPPKEDLIARVIGTWRHSPDFSARGRPSLLSFEGKENQFQTLVHSVSSDLNPYTVLYELDRTGAVTKTADGLKLNVQLHLIKGDREAGVRLVSHDMDDLLNAVEQNIEEQLQTPNLHIRTEYDRIALQHEAEIREWLIDEGSAFHARARAYLANFDCDLNPKLRQSSEVGRVVLGAFSRLEVPEDTGKKSGAKQR